MSNSFTNRYLDDCSVRSISQSIRAKQVNALSMDPSRKHVRDQRRLANCDRNKAGGFKRNPTGYGVLGHNQSGDVKSSNTKRFGKGGNALQIRSNAKLHGRWQRRWIDCSRRGRRTGHKRW